MDDTIGFNQVQPYLSERIRQALEKLALKAQAQEIRLRNGKPLSITSFGKELFITENGGISSSPSLGMSVNKQDIEFSFKAICEYSIHSFQRELSQGFITIPGGHRVGICGTSVTKDGKIDTIKYITGLNFRIARQVLGCADEIIKQAFNYKPTSTLIIGAPSSGKTTILRDLCRQLGNLHKLSIIDERGEIAATHQGVSQNDVGICTDVFDGYPKEDGIMTAIRVMSPEIIAIDEIGDISDCIAIEHSMNAGVIIIATAHAGSVDELYGRKHINALLQQNVFKRIITLGIGQNIGKITDITEVKKFVKDNRHTSPNHNDHTCGDYILEKA